MSKLFDELLRARGVGEGFLKPRYEDLPDPEKLVDVKKAAKRIKEAVKKNERVLIYGDYDVDGVTATTIMYDVLKMSGVKEILTMLPDRFKDGYGMSERVGFKCHLQRHPQSACNLQLWDQD